MATRTKIAWGLAGCLLLLAGWWCLVPKIGTATEAELRAHVAPELLQPLPHPEGGVARFEALRRVLQRLPALSGGRGAQPLDLDDPVVGEAMAILREGPIDRTQANAPQRWFITSWDMFVGLDLDADWHAHFTRVANFLTDAAVRAADRGDWTEVRRHMEASCLLLDRLFESDARVLDRRWTMWAEARIYRATLTLAARRDLPADLAEHLTERLVVDRHSAASLSQVLRGEMQYLVLPRIGERPLSYFHAGTYDPLETAELLSARFLAMVRDAGLPRATWYGSISPQPQILLTAREQLFSPPSRGYRPSISELAWPARRIRLNTTRNSIGRVDAAIYPDRKLLENILQWRTRQDQAAAALAVARFRQRTGRDPRDFAELLAASLLRTAPLDHVRGQALPFDLAALFEWREPRPY